MKFKSKTIGTVAGLMATQKIVYPKTLRDIPPWRSRQLAKDLLWFSRFSPCERLRYVDREWNDIQAFIERFGFRRHEDRKRNRIP
jgi:hypothetical protein